MLCPLRLDIDRIPAGWPPAFDRALVKKHCRVDDNDQDETLELYLRAGIEFVEGSTHRSLISRAHRWVLAEFPTGGRYQQIELPRGKVSSVESIVHFVNGVETTMLGPSSGSSPPSADFQEDLRSIERGVLMPVRGGSWPSADQDVPAPVTINFHAGWDAGLIPDDLVHAVLIATSDMYDIRGAADAPPAAWVGQLANEKFIEAKISGYRLTRWY